MTITPAFYLSGGSSNSDPDAALGGVKSSNAITTATLNNLFDDVDSSEAGSGDTEYRCFYVQNNGDEAWVNPRLWISTETPLAGSQIDIGLDPAGTNATATTAANESTAPGGVTFSHPTTKGAGLNLGILEPGDYAAVWVKRVVSAGAGAQTPDNVVLSFEDYESINLNFMLDWGAAISGAVVMGPTHTASRSTTQTGWDESGVLQTAAVDDPVFDHDPGNSNAALGYLSERAATNECLQSEDWSTSWQNVGLAVTVNNATAPDGATTADKLEDDSAAAGEYIRFNGSCSNDTTTWCAYVFMEKDTNESVFPGLKIWFLGGTAVQADITVNTKTGATAVSLGTPAAYGSIDCGNYWCFWLALSNNGAGNTSLRFAIYPAYASILGGSIDPAQQRSINAWGAQAANIGSPVSYIKTTTAAATRAKNILTASRSGLSEETVVIQARTGYGAGTIWSHDDGTDQERIYIERNSSNEIHCVVVDGGVTQCDLNLGTVADLTAFKVAFSWAANDFQASLNGGTKVTDAAGTLPTRDTLNYGHDYAELNHLGGHLQRVRLFDELIDVEALAA